MRQRNSLKCGGIVLGLMLSAALVAYPGTTSSNLTFTNTQLLRPDGNSEPEISITGDNDANKGKHNGEVKGKHKATGHRH